MTASAPAPAARPRTRWILPQQPDPDMVRGLCDELLLPEPICRLLATRGHVPAELAKRYLRPRLDQLLPPEQLLDLGRAVERIARAIQGGETILVHGDYDVDGISSTTLLTKAFRALGGRVVPFIPRRLVDGYDLTEAGVQAARDAGATVVVTCDCGTSAVSPVRDLQAAGIDVIISDHHLPGGDLPNAYAVLNPKRPGCRSEDKDLAAVGVAFKLALAVTRHLGGNENVVFGMLDLVALATIADIAPLRGENRVFARYGLKMLADTKNLGLRALIRSAGLDGKPLTAGRVGYILAPRLNAVGRLGHALRGVELLTAQSEHEANTIARELEELNARRQEIDRETLEQARRLVATLDLDDTYGIVLAQEGWHPGVIGIVASRIVEEYGRPTVLIALEGEEGKGSGRSISRFDLHAGIGSCRQLLKRFGGHRSAAGVTIARDRIDEFTRCFNEAARAVLSPDDLVPELRIDLEVALADVTPGFEALLRHLEPCGVGNPSPMLVTRGVRLAAPPRVVGQGGLKLRFQTEDAPLEALGWSLGHRIGELDVDRPVDIAFRLERDEYQGVSRLQAKLADFRT
ncbi:MAG TPA: single-stranded-DNA-specific exonuclease RecJ [Gemmatimonadaceae bacterium]|nr:single-stranded-DNA-specific exonuclease RecJ [Gemmatimonadaceae bacterium]